MNIDIKEIAKWLRDHDTDNFDGNMIMDALEEIYQFETKLAKEF